MKLPKTIFMGVISLLLLFIFSSGALAAENSPTKSTASVVFQEGSLTLVSVSNLDFGTHKFSYYDQTYDLSTPSNPTVVVTDDRSGQLGWKVTLVAAKFTNGSNPLDGATIKFIGGSFNQVPLLADPFHAEPTLPITTTNTTIAADGSTSTEIIKATTNTGLGTWETSWSNTNVKLLAPGGKMVTSTYTSELTWTLNDAP